MITKMKNKNMGSVPIYAGLKGISLTQIRFMVNKREREENIDLNEENKRLKIDSGSESEIEEKDSNNITGSNDNRGDNSDSNSEINLESALSSRNEIINRPDFNSDRHNNLNIIRSNENYIENYYNSIMNNIEDDIERMTFDNDFASRLIDTGNRDLVESITGIDPYLIESESDSNNSINEVSEIDPSLIKSDSDDGYHGGSEEENDRSDNGSNISENENSSEDNNSEDNNSEDNSSSGGEGLPSIGNSPVVENSGENFSESPSLNAKISLDKDSERNYSDLVSFVVFQILNLLSFILDIITQILIS